MEIQKQVSSFERTLEIFLYVFFSFQIPSQMKHKFRSLFPARKAKIQFRAVQHKRWKIKVSFLSTWMETLAVSHCLPYKCVKVLDF